MYDSKNRLMTSEGESNYNQYKPCSQCMVGYRYDQNANQWLCDDCCSNFQDLKDSAQGYRAYVSASKITKYRREYHGLRAEKWGDTNAA